jgi:hypothetical protein
VSRSALYRLRFPAVAAAVAALAAGGVLTATGSAGAARASGATHARPRCSDATLRGTYSYGYNGAAVAKGVSRPTATAGFDRFSGTGTSTGVTTYSDNGTIVDNNTPDTSVYTVRANCTGTIVFTIEGAQARFNLYASPSGDSFTLISTGASVVAGTENRVS